MRFYCKCGAHFLSKQDLREHIGLYKHKEVTQDEWRELCKASDDYTYSHPADNGIDDHDS